MSETIILSHQRPLASGSFRDCYRHPVHTDRCIKIVRPGLPDHRGRLARWLRLSPSDPNQLEFAEYQRHEPISSLTHYFPRLYGFVETDLGPGLCLELLQDREGHPPVSLEALTNNRSCLLGITTDRISADFSAFAAFCTAHNIVAFCDELNNVGYLQTEVDYRFVAFDMKHRINKELLPLSSLLTAMQRRKIARRFQRTALRLQALLSKR